MILKNVNHVDKTIVMLLTNPFLPDPRPLKEAKLLLKNNFCVKLIAWNRDRDNILPEKERYSGIDIVRIKGITEYRKGLNNIIKFLKFYIHIVQILKNESSLDIIYAHDFDTLIPAVYLKLCNNKVKIVLDSHEQYEGLFTRKKNFKSKILYLIIIILKKILYKKVDLFIFTNNIRMETDETIIRKKISNYCIIENYPEQDFFTQNINSSNDDIHICYFGNIRDFKILKKVACSIEASNKYFHVAGMGRDAHSILNEFADLNNSEYLGSFSYDQLKDLYKNMDLVICLYQKDKNMDITFPVKFFEALNVGIPVVAFEGTALGDFVKKYNIGFTINPEANYNDFFGSLTFEKISFYKEKIANFDKLNEFIFNNQEIEFIDSINEIF